MNASTQAKGETKMEANTVTYVAEESLLAQLEDVSEWQPDASAAKQNLGEPKAETPKAERIVVL